MKRASPSSAPRLVPVGAAALVALVGLGAVLPAAAVAQERPDFLFGSPRVTLGIKGGYAQPLAGSDVFDLVRDELTVETGDFGSTAIGVDVAFRLTERLDLAADFVYSASETRSEFRDWVDMDDRPIEQTTSFSRMPLTLSVKGYLWERGRSVGQFAWIPRDWTPYAGIGGGVLWWNFEQEGDFVDFETLDIFRDTFVSSGATETLHALAGVEMSLGPRFFLTAEGRYSWAEAEMDRDFVGFEPIDLSGFQLTIGISGRLSRPGG